MVKMTIRHQVVDDDKEQWLAEFDRKKSMREAFWDSIVYTDGPNEIVVVHQVKDTIMDALNAIDHFQVNKISRERAESERMPSFSE